MAKIGGFWAGDFAFAPDGSLLISSGNVVGARLYKLDVATGTATKLYQASNESLTGFAADAKGVLYLTNQAKWIYRLDLALGSGPRRGPPRLARLASREIRGLQPQYHQGCERPRHPAAAGTGTGADAPHQR